MTINKQIYADNAKTILASGIGPSDTTIFVIDGSSFPVPNPGEFFQITLEWADFIEVINVYSRVGNTFSNCVRGRSNHTARSFPDGTTVQMRISSEALSSFARLQDRMDEVASVDNLASPNNSDGNSYICHSADFGGGHIIAIKTSSTKWSFPTHGVTTVLGTVESVGVNTITSSSIASNVSDVVPGKYLLQITSGDNRGLVRMVTSSAPNSVSWVTALPNTLTTGVSFEIYQSHSAILAKLLATSNAGSTSDPTKVNKAGDTMTGLLRLAGNPIDGLDAVPLNYLNQALASTNAIVRKPLNITPAGSAVGVSTGATLQANNYYSLYGVAQSAAQFQVSTVPDFASTVRDVTLGAVNSWTIAPVLSTATPYFWRCRFKDAENVWSAWSDVTSFSTGTILVNAPTLTSPSSGATNVNTLPTLTSSAFSVTGGSDTHVSSRWQIATDTNFTNIVVDSTESTSAKLSYTVSTALSFGVTYYARVHHTGVTNGQSAWSTTSSFVTFNGGVVTPTMVSPGDSATGVSVNPTLSTSAFANIGPTDTHMNTDWEIRTAAGGGGTLVWSSYNNALNKTTINASAGLTYGVTYYVRALHRGTTFGASSWSNSNSFTTVSGVAAQPSITSPISGSTGVSLSPTITTTAFSSSSGDTHLSTDWEIRTADGGGGTVIWSSYNNTVNKVSINASGLTNSTVYYIRARHKGNTYGLSTWSNSAMITTLAASGEALFTSPGTYNWTVPDSVTSISGVVIGGGGQGINTSNLANSNGNGGGGGGLAWTNGIAVTPGQVIQVLVESKYANGVGGTAKITVGGLSFEARGGGSQNDVSGGASLPNAGLGTSRGGGAGGNGGVGVVGGSNFQGGGGGGAGGYNGKGGNGGNGGDGGDPVNKGQTGTDGGGGGEGGHQYWYAGGGGGGGIGLWGDSTGSGTGGGIGGTGGASNGEGGFPGSGGGYGQPGEGSGGDSTPLGGNGGNFGGGQGAGREASMANPGASAAARIIWGPGRSFPNNAN